MNRGPSERLYNPWAMVPPNALSAARAGSTWIHWWSPVSSANASMRSCVMSCHAVGPRSEPTRSCSSWIDVGRGTAGVVVMVGGSSGQVPAA